MKRTSASVSAPEPPRGSVHERRWRPKTIDEASWPEPGRSIGTSVWNACQSMNERTCSDSYSWRMTSHALISRRRCQIAPARVLGQALSSEGPNPGGVNVAAPKTPLTSSYSASVRR